MPVCKCGCGTRIPKGRTFVDKAHQITWLKGEGKKNWPKRPESSAHNVHIMPDKEPSSPLPTDTASHIESKRESEVDFWSYFISEAIVHIGGATLLSFVAVLVLDGIEFPNAPVLRWFIGLLGVWLVIKSIWAMLFSTEYVVKANRINIGQHGRVTKGRANLPRAPIIYFVSRGMLSGVLLYAAYIWPHAV